MHLIFLNQRHLKLRCSTGSLVIKPTKPIMRTRRKKPSQKNRIYTQPYSSTIRSSPVKKTTTNSSTIRSSPVKKTTTNSSTIRSSPVKKTTTNSSTIRSSPVKKTTTNSSTIRSSPVKKTTTSFTKLHTNTCDDINAGLVICIASDKMHLQ